MVVCKKGMARKKFVLIIICISISIIILLVLVLVTASHRVKKRTKFLYFHKNNSNNNCSCIYKVSLICLEPLCSSWQHDSGKMFSSAQRCPGCCLGVVVLSAFDLILPIALNAVSPEILVAFLMIRNQTWVSIHRGYHYGVMSFLITSRKELFTYASDTSL